MSTERPAEAGTPDWVSATDVSTYAYCGRLYWLLRVAKRRPDAAAQPRLTGGERHHKRHGRAYVRQRVAHRAVLAGVVAAGAVTLAAGVALGGGQGNVFAPWVDAALLVIAVVLGMALSGIVRSRRLERVTRLPSQAAIHASDTGRVQSSTLRDHERGFYGRPDYVLEEIVEGERRLIPVEVKPTKRSTRLYESDEMQLVHYLRLLRQAEGEERVPFGRVVYETAAWVVELSDDSVRRHDRYARLVREARRAETVHRTHRIPGRCRGCAVRAQCGESLAPPPPPPPAPPGGAEG